MGDRKNVPPVAPGLFKSRVCVTHISLLSGSMTRTTKRGGAEGNDVVGLDSGIGTADISNSICSCFRTMTRGRYGTRSQCAVDISTQLVEQMM